ncbi:hypothetical protein AMTRI_Chr01g128260 [Amborella trichopoda]
MTLEGLKNFEPDWQILTVKIWPRRLKQVPLGYVMRVGIGTPAELYWLIADAGSNLTWAQCLPCSNCFKQNNSHECGGSSCQYDYEYGYGSATSGKLSTETFTFETPRSTLTSLSASISANPSSSLTISPSTDPIKTSTSATFTIDRSTCAKIKGFGFGCGPSNTGGFGTNGEAGLLGLGGGPFKITRLPDITFHFSEDADQKMGPSNVLYSLHEDVICLAIVTTDDVGPFNFRNWQQQTMVVEYDLGENRMSFAPAQCSQLYGGTI